MEIGLWGYCYRVDLDNVCLCRSNDDYEDGEPGDARIAVENEVAAILARSQDRVAIRGGRRHEEDWQEQS